MILYSNLMELNVKVEKYVHTLESKCVCSLHIDSKSVFFLFHCVMTVCKCVFVCFWYYALGHINTLAYTHTRTRMHACMGTNIHTHTHWRSEILYRTRSHILHNRRNMTLFYLSSSMKNPSFFMSIYMRVFCSDSHFLIQLLLPLLLSSLYVNSGLLWVIWASNRTHTQNFDWTYWSGNWTKCDR